MAKIEYETKPTDEEIARYEKQIEHYLDALKVKVKIHRTAQPYESHFSINDDETTTRHWIENVTITTPEVKDFEVLFLESGIDTSEKWKEHAWYDAAHIQGLLYQKLKRDPQNPSKGDPYWKLWSKHPTHPS